MAPIRMFNSVPAKSRRSTGSARKRKLDEGVAIFHSVAKRQKTPSAATSKTPPAAFANTAVANVTLPSPPPTESSASSATADAPITSSPSASEAIAQSSVATPPTAILAAPDYSPAACFTQTPPAPFTPWPHSFPAPTPRFAQPLSCPVDWSKLAGLKAEDIEAYELRAAWNPTPVSFRTVMKQSRYLVKDVAPSEPCIRQRFNRASLIIFKISGVYFEDTALGLKAYGVPTQDILRRLVSEKSPEPSRKPPHHKQSPNPP
ncbi:hypothetical protein OPT61_g10680 [Boeremia exigua]|uniref:Uncharacterized protein n=1 Tax=Boeremia exigua TaxID=749465 RepID=A0ACC2HNH0_9PLEO|nr:hypothetical protein OPT61_g10680 [Boeremia exigua]